MLIALAPHAYSGTLLTTSSPTSTKGNPKSTSTKSIYNLANPRSSSNNAKYQSALPPATYGKWERARAAHANMFDNSAFFVSAILAGIVTRCEASYMNRMAGWYLASRVAYVISYISVERGWLATLRTGWYMVGNVILFAIWWKAGKKVMAGDY